MSQKFVHINGTLVPYEQATAPLYDHSLLYGDGAFEGIRSYNGKVFKLDEHLDRMYYSAKALAIDLPVTQDVMRNSLLELCRVNDHQNGYIRLTITRGTFLGLDPKHSNGPANVYISTEQLTLYPQAMYDNGLTMITVSTRVPPTFVSDPRIKCTGKYTNNIQAKMEANRAGVGEGVMLNLEGYVMECTGDNIFIVKNGVIRTPPPSTCGLVGITRTTVIQVARAAGIQVDEALLTPYDIYTADECFLTGTGAEVIPAVVLDGRSIGTGKPGPVTGRVIGLFRQHTRETGVAF
ncbi:MAG: branched-chain-amino-acid transaminase [Capsulimonadaceae bacterium]|nr:branched-chain-amino-acid transaminase [Capsulimonadaceae bacterium]